VDEYKQIILQLRRKHQNAEKDALDIEKENLYHKDELLETIRQ
jgi:hypothetical protein